MDEKNTIHDLEMQAKNTQLLINRLTKAYMGKEIQELLHAEPRNPYTFEDYCSALKQGNARYRDLVLARACQDKSITFAQLQKLVILAANDE